MSIREMCTDLNSIFCALLFYLPTILLLHERLRRRLILLSDTITMPRLGDDILDFYCHVWVFHSKHVSQTCSNFFLLRARSLNYFETKRGKGQDWRLQRLRWGWLWRWRTYSLRKGLHGKVRFNLENVLLLLKRDRLWIQIFHFYPLWEH
jgi:hypothetical protein